MHEKEVNYRNKNFVLLCCFQCYFQVRTGYFTVYYIVILSIYLIYIYIHCTWNFAVFVFVILLYAQN